MRRYPVSTKLNNSQNEGAESATRVTLDTLIQARLFELQLFLNTHAETLRCRRIAGEGSNGLGLRTKQQIECDDVRGHQHGHVDDRDRVRGAQFCPATAGTPTWVAW